MFGYEYFSGIGVIEKTYSVSRQALHDQKYTVYGQLEAIRRGELEDRYDPEEGLPSLSDELEYELGQIESARQNLCQAVLVMLYHFWEKQVLGWAGNLKGKDRHKKYVEYCVGVGFKIDGDRLEELRCLTNLVKHGQGKSEWGRPALQAQSVIVSTSLKYDQPAGLSQADRRLCRGDFSSGQRLGAGHT